MAEDPKEGRFDEVRVFLSHPELSYFLYPEAKRIREFGYIISEEKVLYQLREGQKINEIDNSMSSCFRDHIIVTTSKSHAVDVSLDIRAEYLTYISAYRKIRPAKDLEKRIEKLSDEDFIAFIKMSLGLKRWYREIFQAKEKMYKLFEVMVGSKKEFITLYVELVQNLSPQEIFSSVLTFYTRIVNWETQKESLGDYYRNIVRMARNQTLNIKQTLLKVISLPPEIPAENKFLGFYLSVKG